MNTAFWKGKKVLITGHTGFKGAWLSLWLQKLGASVSGYSLPSPTTPSLYELARVGEGMNGKIGDIRDSREMEEFVSDIKPEIVVHMAAQPLVRYSYTEPVETYTTNVIGTLNVLELLKKVGGIRVALVITSDKCYENKEWRWGYRENERLGGHDPYSSSKACAEILTSSFRDSYFPLKEYKDHGIAIATARSGNVIGGGDWAEDRLIPDILRSYEKGKKVVIRNPDATRPWQHVLEPLCGYLSLMEKLWSEGDAYSGAWNFGPEELGAKPVSWVVDRIANELGGNMVWEIDSGIQPHEASNLKLDSAKARMELDWEPRWGIDDTLTKVIEWYKAYYEKVDMRLCTLEQISEFENTTSI